MIYLVFSFLFRFFHSPLSAEFFVELTSFSSTLLNNLGTGAVKCVFPGPDAGDDTLARLLTTFVADLGWEVPKHRFWEGCAVAFDRDTLARILTPFSDFQLLEAGRKRRYFDGVVSRCHLPKDFSDVVHRMVRASDSRVSCETHGFSHCACLKPSVAHGLLTVSGKVFPAPIVSLDTLLFILCVLVELGLKMPLKKNILHAEQAVELFYEAVRYSLLPHELERPTLGVCDSLTGRSPLHM